ncbi:MAG: DUF5916 domain-containing protein [Chitinophagaceae bacterium]
MLIRQFWLIALLAISFKLLSQDSSYIGNFLPEIPTPNLIALETTEKIMIDGKLTEDVWKKAAKTNRFFRMEPRQGGKYLYETYVQVVFDKINIYFGVFCKDSLGKKGVRVQDLRRDFSYGENDVFFLQLDPQNLKRFCVSFQTTPYGNQRDAQIFDDALVDNDWDALWKVRTTICDSGYYAEFAIPFASLRYQKQQDNNLNWGITLARLARREYEQTVFPAVPQAFSPYRMSYAAQLKGLKLPQPSINIRVQPYTLYTSNKTTNNSNSTIENQLKVGGDIKWAINSHSVVDATFNTDFAQADVDRAVNNTSRFNVFFPERRQFFLENSGVYTGANYDGIKPFFSRTIGLDNTQFNANTVPINGGLRFTNRTQKNTIAALYVHQRETNEQAAANFGVFRYLKNYGKQNNMGVMLTHRIDEANINKGLSQKTNSTLSIDGFIRPNNNWQIEYMVSVAKNNTADSIGFASYFYTGYFPQNAYIGWLTKFVDEKYMPGMGFVFANNTIHNNPGGYFIWRPKNKLGKLIRRWDPGFFINWYQNAHNLSTQEFSFYIFPIYIITAYNGLIEFSISPTWQNFLNPFPILGKTVATGKYNYTRNLLRYNTDRSKKISAELKYEFGGYYNGNLNTVYTDIRFAPIPHIAFNANFEHNQFKNFGVNNDNFSTTLSAIGLRLAYNPRIQLSTFYQYNSFDKRGRLNIRGSWEIAPLSFFYIVFNENNFNNTGLKNQNLITKFTYLKQF